MLEIERQPELFTNGPEPVMATQNAINNRQMSIKTLIHMDAPEHGKYRRLTNEWFKPASIRRLGAHFCLGAQLARNELRRLFQHVLPRLESIELAVDPTLMKTTFVGGHKTLPIRYELTAS